MNSLKAILVVPVLLFTSLSGFSQDTTSYKFGLDYYKKQQFAEAIFWLNKSINEGTKLPESYMYRGTSLAALGKTEEGYRDILKSLALDSNNYMAYKQMGIFFALQKKYDTAIQWYSKAIARNTTDGLVYNSRSAAYVDINHLDAALKDADKAIALNNKSPDFYNNRGFILLKMQDYKKAADDFRKSLQIDSTSGGASVTYANLAECHLALKQYSIAIDLCNKVMINNPRYTTALRVRGESYFYSGDKKNACRDFEVLEDVDAEMGNKYLEKYCKDSK